MADYQNPFNNRNNRGDFARVEPNDTQSSFYKKQLEEYDKYKKDLDRKTTKEVNDYRMKLYMASDVLSWKKQEEYLKKFIKYKKQQEEQLQKQLAKSAQHIEDELALQRKKQREEEQAQEREWLEGKLERYKETFKDENASFKDRAKALIDMAKTQNELNKTNPNKQGTLDKLLGIVNGMSSDMNRVIDTYSKYQSTINTRLQGSSSNFNDLQNTLLRGVGASPYLKTQAMLDNLQKLVESGISFNLEQRAFLSTVSDKIASTFNAFDSNLMRIVRLQQADSTASRLGMEAYLTKFLNNMFSDTSYLNQAFDTVTGNLVEATSQMTTQMGVQFEYVIQKWLGSLSSVGMSDASIGNIAQAMGYLATGNVQGLESSGMQNLIVMAASRAGLSYADMLTRGINLTETNQLLGSMVEYLQQIGSSTNQVVKNQYASTFGVSVSDLRAAGNLSANDVKNIGANMLSYSGSLGELNTQLSTIGQRLSIAEKINNVIGNAQFSMYSGIASNPALMGLWKVTDMIQSYTGGINIPAIFGMGTGVNMNTTVENLMKLGIMGIGSLGMIGDVMTGLSSTSDFSKVFDTLGGANLVTTGRGTGITSRSSGWEESDSGYIGQSSGSAFYEQTMSKANEETQNQITQNKSEDDISMRKDIADVLLSLHNNVADILNIMRTGVPTFTANYGLTTDTNI